MVVHTRKPARYVPAPHVVSASTAGQGYIRWPSVLVNCHWIQNEIVRFLPPGTKVALGPGELPEPPPPPKFHPTPGADLKLLLFMVYKSAGARDGYGTAKIGEVEEFMGAGFTKHQIREAVHRMQDQMIRIDPDDLADGDTQFNQCKLFDFTSRITKNGDISWRFDSHFMIALAATHHYGRLNMRDISGLDSFAALRLYAKFCYTTDADHRRVWQADIIELKKLLNSQARNDNFQQRVLEPALNKIKSTGAFYYVKAKPIYDSGRGQQIAFFDFTFDFRGYRGAQQIEKPEQPWPELEELLAAAEKHEAEQLMAAALAERQAARDAAANYVYVPGSDLLGEMLGADPNAPPAPPERRQVAKIQRDADGRIPNFVVGYLKAPKFRSQPVYHAMIPERVGAICGTGAWIPAPSGTKVSCPKCRTLIRKATSTRPVLKLKQPKEAKPKKPTRRDLRLAAWAAAEAARVRPPQPPGPMVVQFHNRIGSPPPPGPLPPAPRPRYLKPKPEDPGL